MEDLSNDIIFASSMDSTCKFRYPPLVGFDAIRLLQIEPEKEWETSKSLVQCRIQHFNIHDAPPYLALSYTWGQLNRKSRLHLNGEYLEVGRNLLDALRHLRNPQSIYFSRSRFPETSPWIWIDALSIDQGNTSERNHQVRLMGSIFKTAAEVLAWLGSEKGAGYGSSIFTAAISTLENLHHHDRIGSLPTLNELSQCCQIFNRTYWKRMWIVQEIGLAADITVLFGSSHTKWSSIRHLRNILEHRIQQLPNEVHGEFEKLSQHITNCQGFILDRHRASAQLNNLADLIESCQDCLCSDPRDKVYALLGLATDCQNNELQIDYSKPLYEVYADVIRFYHDRRPHPRCPGELKDGAETALSHLKQTSGHILIKMLGIIVGTIATTTDALQNRYDLGAAVEIRSSLPYAIQAKHEIEVDSSKYRSFPTASPKVKPAIAKYDSYVIFTTREGRQGYATANCSEGDLIVQFLGCDIAAVLRRGHKAYEVIGRPIVRKSIEEEAWPVEPWSKKYRYSILDFHKEKRWDEDQEVFLYVDMPTLQQLTTS